MCSDGYGIIRADHDAGEFVLECWPYAVDPTADETERAFEPDETTIKAVIEFDSS